MFNFDWGRLDPRFWLQNSKTNNEWDAILNDLMDEHTPIIETGGARFGNILVWTNNWPYAYGTPSPVGSNYPDYMPRVATRKRLRRIMNEIERKAEEEEMNKLRRKAYEN